MKISQKSPLLFIIILFFASFESRLCLGSEVSEMVSEAATDAAKSMAGDLGLDVGEDAAENIEKLTNILKNAMKDVPSGVSKEVADAAASEAVESLKSLSGVEAGEEDIIAKITQASTENFDALTKSVTDASVASIRNLVRSGAMGEAEAGELLAKMGSSGDALTTMDKFLGKFGLGGADSKLFSLSVGDVTEEGAEDALKNTEEEAEKGEGTLAKVKEFVLQQVGMLVFMTIPQIMQQSIEAELARVAQLRSIARPGKFGNWVVQIVDSCIDRDNPEASIGLYEMIPVAKVGDSVDANIEKAFNNSIAGSTYSYSLEYWGHSVSRYKIVSSEYYKYARFVMSYPSNTTYESFGKQPVTLSQSPAYMIDMNQGHVVDPTGAASVSPPQPPLIPRKGHPVMQGQSSVKAISQSLPTIYGKLKSAKLVQTYTALAGGSSSGPTVSQSVLDYFDCDSQTGVSLEKGTSSTKGVECVLENALNAYQTGRAFGGLGIIMPVFGWDTGDYKNILSKANFPHKSKLSVGKSGATVKLYTDGRDTSKSSLSSGKTAAAPQGSSDVFEFAKPANYLSEGCWVCLCAESPFAQAVQEGSSDTSVMGPYVDYVVFFDENENQVPAFAPIEQDIGKTITQVSVQDVNNVIMSLETGAAKGKTVFDMYTDLQHLQTMLRDAKMTMPSSTKTVLNTIVKEHATAKAGSKSSISSGELMTALQTLKQSLTTTLGGKGKSSGTDAGVIKWPVISWNPKAKYMASLISYNISEFSVQGQIVAYPKYPKTKKGIAVSQALIEKAISDFQKGFPLLYSQFDQHRKALLVKYSFGPFLNGKVTAASQYNLADSKEGVTVRIYTGPACQGTTGSNKVEDLLLVADAGGSPLNLPDSSVAQVYSLVTDMIYTVQTDKSLRAVGSKAYGHAPGDWNEKKHKFIPNQDKESDLYWLPLIKKLYEGEKISFGTSYDTLLEEVKKRRKAWFDNYSDKALVTGVDVGDMQFKLASELDVQAAEANRFYVYEVSPSPSATLVSNDYFVAVNFEQPTISTLEMVNVAESPSAAKSLVSLVTGNVYDANGQHQVDRSGRPVVIQTTATSKVETIGQELYAYFDQTYAGEKGMSEAFAQAYKDEVDKYATLVNRPIMKGEFGGMHLGIYAGDLAMKIFVYFNTAGLTSSASFEAKDLFVTVTPVQGQSPVFGKELTEDTPFIVSLVSGQVYDKTGPKFVMPIDGITKYASSQAVYWRGWLSDTLAKLQVAYHARQKALKTEAEKLADKADVVDAHLQWTKTNVQGLIARVRRASKLPFPYGLLKRDPITRRWIRLAPASTTNKNEFSYTVFNVPSSYKTPDGKPMQVGAIYSQQGELLQVLKGPGLQAMMHQYGVYGDAETTIGIPMMQPSMLIDEDDKSLKPGSNGSSLIVSSSPSFPGDKVKLATGYYLYYNIKMNNYYVLDSKNKEWIDASSGNVYNMSGQPVPARQAVAINAQSKSNIMLLEENNAGHMQSIMEDPYHDGLYTEWKNYGNGPWKSSYGDAKVIENKKGQNQKTDSYDVEFEGKTGTKKKTYKVNVAYEWEDMIFVPITADRELLQANQIPSALYRKARVVKNKGKLVYFMFAGHMYRVSKSSGSNAYTMITVDSKKAKVMNLHIKIDTNTNVPYIVATLGSGKDQVTYRFAYLHKKLAKDEFSALQTEVIKGNVVVCPSSILVKQEAKGRGSATALNFRTFTRFIPDIPSPDSMDAVDVSDVRETPDPDSSTSQVFSGMLFRVHKASDGRYFANLYKNDGQSIHEPFIKYFNRNGFVDLSSGALFDQYGNSVGTSLTLDDWLAVLNKLQVIVNRTEDGKRAIFYRRASVIQVQEEQQLTMGPSPAKAQKPKAKTGALPKAGGAKKPKARVGKLGARTQSTVSNLKGKIGGALSKPVGGAGKLSSRLGITV